LAAGIATALLIGRLDSKFIGLPAWVMTSLYGYAVVQAGWPAFPKNDAARAVLLNLAFPLKCLFFLVMSWLYQSGVFAFYIDRIGLLYDEVAGERWASCGRFQGKPGPGKPGKERARRSPEGVVARTPESVGHPPEAAQR
jgi:hypothetical protein